jgi:uncharacterized protein DUF2380
MARPSLTLTALAFSGMLLNLAAASAAEPASRAVVVEIDDFRYLDTSGEAADQSGKHEIRRQAFMDALRRDFETDDRYKLALSSCVSPCVTGTVTADRLRAASPAGTAILVVGGIQKMSTLVQWAKASAIDVAAGRILFERLYTFRGDDDEAWRRAEMFISREIRERLVTERLAGSADASQAPQAAGREPTKLAVFDFELEDSSAAAPSIGKSAIEAADAAELAKTSEAVREMLAQSPRYRLIDVSSVGAHDVKAHKLHECDGCDAGTALALGADQSLVGVIRRVSRTEYTIRFQLRETRTGAILASADSGLRMGANYSWNRGAVRLISNRLLETQPSP